MKNSLFEQQECLAPYGGQTSSSCGGLVAFGHQMGALQAPWLVKLKFGALCTPPSSSCGGLMAFAHLISAMFVYGFGCFCFIHHGTPTGSLPKSFVKIQLDLAEIYRIYKYVFCLFLCLFMDLLLFVLIIMGHPQEVSLKVL